MSDNQQSGQSVQPGGNNAGSNQKPQLSWGQPPNQGGNKGGGNSSSTTATKPAPSSRLVGTFVAGLVIGLLVAWAWFDLHGAKPGNSGTMATSSGEFTVTQTAPENSGTEMSSSSAPADNTSSVSGQTGATGTSAAGAAISIPETQPAGSSVEVSSITASQPVWAVVYSNSNRTGQIMGAARFAVRTSGTIELVHMTKPGVTYFVGLVADTPDHTYVPRVNSPITGSDGAQVMAQFTAQ